MAALGFARVIQEQNTQKQNGLVSGLIRSKSEISLESNDTTTRTSLSSSPILAEKKYFKEFLFSNKTTPEIYSIRDPTELLDPELTLPLAEQEFFVKWLKLYVVESQKNSTWNPKIPHQKLLLAWGSQGMGKLTQTTILAHQNRINLLYCSLYTLKSGMWCSIFKRALEIQPAIVFIDNFANLFSREYSCYLTEFCAIFEEYFKNPKTRVWVVCCTSIEPISEISHFKFILDLVHKHGTVTLVPNLNGSDHRVRQNIATEMMRNVFSVGVFPNPSDAQKAEWQNILTDIGTYTQYCTLKEIKDFIVKTHQNTYAIWFSSFVDDAKKNNDDQQCDFSLERIVPSVFKTMFSSLPYMKEDDSVKTIAFNRRVYDDHIQQSSLWMSYSTKFMATPFNAGSFSKHEQHTPISLDLKVNNIPLARLLKKTSSKSSENNDTVPKTPPHYLHTLPYSPTSPAQDDSNNTSSYSLDSSEYNPTGYFMSSPSRSYASSSPSRTKRYAYDEIEDDPWVLENSAKTQRTKHSKRAKNHRSSFSRK